MMPSAEEELADDAGDDMISGGDCNGVFLGLGVGDLMVEGGGHNLLNGWRSNDDLQ